MSDQPTLHTLVQATGLSLATVSRALGPSTQVSPEARARVLAAAKKLGYTRDPTAVRLRTGRSKTLAYLMDPRAALQPGFMPLLGGLSAAVWDSDYHLLVLPEPAETDPLDTTRYLLQRRLADGAVLTHTAPQDARIRLLQERGYPCISHGRTRLPTPHATVDFDNAAFAADAVANLVARGRSRLAIVLPRPDASYREHLVEGFDTACQRAGLSGRRVAAIDLDSPPAAVDAWARQAMTHIDGLVLSGEAPLLPVLGALTDIGLRPGTDLDVALKYSSTLPQSLRTPLLTCHENLHHAGLSLGRALMQMLAEPEAPPLQVLFPPPPIEALHHANP